MIIAFIFIDYFVNIHLSINLQYIKMKTYLKSIVTHAQ